MMSRDDAAHAIMFPAFVCVSVMMTPMMVVGIVMTQKDES